VIVRQGERRSVAPVPRCRPRVPVPQFAVPHTNLAPFNAILRDRGQSGRDSKTRKVYNGDFSDEPRFKASRDAQTGAAAATAAQATQPGKIDAVVDAAEAVVHAAKAVAGKQVRDAQAGRAARALNAAPAVQDAAKDRRRRRLALALQPEGQPDAEPKADLCRDKVLPASHAGVAAQTARGLGGLLVVTPSDVAADDACDRHGLATPHAAAQGA
jgi:hypothetical protein